jgi:hypothetical protein
MTLCLRWDEVLVYQPENSTVKAAVPPPSRRDVRFSTKPLSFPNRAPSPVRNLLLLSVNLPRSFLEQSLLQFLLALDAVPRPWHRFQPLGIDLFAAVDALAKAAFADARQRFLHHLQQLPLVVALAEQKFFGVGTGCAVGNVLRRVFIGRAAVGLRARHRAPQVLLPRLQPLFECF